MCACAMGTDLSRGELSCGREDGVLQLQAPLLTVCGGGASGRRAATPSRLLRRLACAEVQTVDRHDWCICRALFDFASAAAHLCFLFALHCIAVTVPQIGSDRRQPRPALAAPHRTAPPPPPWSHAPAAAVPRAQTRRSRFPRHPTAPMAPRPLDPERSSVAHRDRPCACRPALLLLSFVYWLWLRSLCRPPPPLLLPVVAPRW